LDSSSVGNYKGSGLVIGGKQYSAKYRPTYFNGKFLEHYNLPREDTDGTKYSLVFYTNEEKDAIYHKKK
jgi:hypothetical protein